MSGINVGGAGIRVSGGGSSSSSPILAIATCQTRTQASYTAPNASVIAMTSDLDLVFADIPVGTSKVKLDWVVNVEDSNATSSAFVVYKSVNGGAFALLTESRDGSANFYSVITRPWDGEYTATPQVSAVSVIDNNPDIGDAVTYRLYVANIRNDGSTGLLYLNRSTASAGGNLYPACNSTGEAKCL